MKLQSLTKQFTTILGYAMQLCEAADAHALLVVLNGPTEWDKLKELTNNQKVIVTANEAEALAGAAEAGLQTVVLDMPDAPIFEQLTQALLESVADEILSPSAEVIAVYSGFEPGKIDSISHIRLDEHLGRLTSRDLQQMETSVPLDTLKTVVDLAVAIGREGREGKPIGTMFIVGDTRRVLAHCHTAGFDAVKGYKRAERDLNDPRAREGIKEIAQLDGAFVVSSEGIVERSCQIVDSSHADLTLSKGLGSRHWAAAAITKNTKAIAVVVSESSGTVRIFQKGEVMLRVEPFRRAMKWKDFEYEPPTMAGNE